MRFIQRLPPWLQQPVMAGAMKAMQNPSRFIRQLILGTLSTNLAILFIPHFIKAGLLISEGKYDNTMPHSDNQKRRESSSRHKDIVNRCTRAHRNSLETFPLFSIAVLACLVQLVDHPGRRKSLGSLQSLLKTSLRYTLCRILFIIVYIFGTNKWLSFLRTLLYFDNISCVFRIFRLAISA